MNELILIIDDDKVILELAAIVFRSSGYRVLCATEGRSGLQLIAEAHPDLVLLDYMMPGMDGIEVLNDITRNAPDTAVIMFTGLGNEEVAVRAMKAGAADYIVKPFRNQDLLERTRNVLRLRRSEMHNRELLAERERMQRQLEGWNLELERRVEEKSQELEAAHAEIMQVEKLATLGHIAAGLAHEIRNPLNSINLFAQILRNSDETGAESTEFLERIQSEVERIDSLVVRLLAASRSQSRMAETVQVSRIAEEAIAFFLPQITAQRVSLDQEIGETTPLFGDQEEMRQVFTNLISNALHAMPDGGRLHLKVAQAAGQILIELSDSGCGIPREDLRRIFDPFFTTRTKGTGFGLSVVLRIVKTYGGKIAVTSEPFEGTTFRIVLPLPDSAPESMQ